MLKQSWVLALGIAALAALCWSDAAVARLAANGTSLNGTSLNGTSLNGTSLNGTSLNGLTPNAVTLQAVRLALPDGKELIFR